MNEDEKLRKLEKTIQKGVTLLIGSVLMLFLIIVLPISWVLFWIVIGWVVFALTCILVFVRGLVNER